ncbi:hypothetical protein EMPS_06136 [Entomortierella parvispora]|uniref:Uncharacterized protein n=1 Tax=Entomortierella parvispora TaxID=205924 RepID=A0A9P3LX62_9FUNG|nr:hypothetical protein EMPS_06136 [Entomortierella parvispora]
MIMPSPIEGDGRGQEDDDGIRLPEHPSSPEQEFNQPKVVSPTVASFVENSPRHPHGNQTRFNQSPFVAATPEFQDARSSAVEPEIHLLPSQLRHRHETTKAQRQQQQLLLKEQALSEDTQDSSSLNTINVGDSGSYFQVAPSEDPTNKDDRSSHLLDTETVVESPLRHQGGKATFNDHDSSNEDTNFLQMTPPDNLASSFHCARGGDSGALVRANSYSIFESLSNKSRGPPSDSSYDWSSTPIALSQASHFPKNIELAAGESLAEGRWSSDLPEIMMPTRDWVKMQTRINSLEQEVLHVTRTNILLNQELDKLNNHLLRLTSEEGAGWRKEYEFLVQQVDLMHRQLQLAYSQGQGGGGSAVASLSTRPNNVEGQSQQPEMTSQLHAEVKDLTASLRSWQAAFQQAEEKYRKKCDGERVLKQTLRERETQLSALAAKLSGYEDEFQKSISNYEQLVRLSTELEVLEGKKRRSSKSDSTSVDSSRHGALRNRISSRAEKDEQATATLQSNRDVVAHQLQGHMPGVFPGGEQRLVLAPNVDKLTVSIMSWAALLATYMLS